MGIPRRTGSKPADRAAGKIALKLIFDANLSPRLAGRRIADTGKIRTIIWKVL
jgi:hypothetical protein